MKRKTFYYTNELEDDFATSVKKLKPLPEKYKYVHDTLFERIFSFIAYRILLKPFAWIYMKLRFGVKIVKSKEYKKLRGGYLIYANHTLLLGDALLPSLIDFRKKNYVIVGEQANSLTALLPIMRSVGAIPLTENRAQNLALLRCVKKRISQRRSVTIYPEAHVWPYYTGIRPYPPTSLKYAAILNAPVVCVTNCFQKRRFGNRPKLVTFVDGPYYPDPQLSAAENTARLHEIVYQTMQRRTKENSNYSVHEYSKYPPLKWGLYFAH